MFRNYLMTALRNLERNRFYAAISILGLAVAFTVAILIAQFVRNEFSYDRWIPGYQQVYKVAALLQQLGHAPVHSDRATAGVARRLKTQFPHIVAAARLHAPSDDEPLRRPGDAAVFEPSFAWADPDIFDVFPLPALAGDLQSALQQPDTVVITRRMARKYFGRDLPIGDTLQIQALKPQPPGTRYPDPEHTPWYSMRVTAVLEDLPSNTSLTTEIFASGRSAYSDLSFDDAVTPTGNMINFTFVRLRPGATASDLQRALNVAGQPDIKFYADVGEKFSFHPVPLAELHLTATDHTFEAVKPVGSRSNAYAVSAVGALIVLVAAINFVTLLTARAARRALEVGVRKATGARRADLMVQFVGEALIQVGLGALIAMALAELLIPSFGAFTQRELALDYLHDPALLVGILGATLVIGLVAAVYPAVVLSSFRPAAVLKGGPVQAAGSVRARQALVVVQFAVLVGLIVTTATLYRQTQFAMARGFGGGADSGRIVRVQAACSDAFPYEVRKLPGVSAAACSSLDALNTPNSSHGLLAQAGGRQEIFSGAPVDFGFLELYGLRPLAGRLFSADYGEDSALASQPAGHPTLIVNETAARRLGYANPKAAIGQSLTWANSGTPGHWLMRTSRIVGVVPDMPRTVRSATDPFVYYVVPKRLNVLSIKLTGQDVPGTLRAIDQAWRRTGHARPIQETFVSQFRTSLYLDLIIQGVTIGICAGLAVLIACLGLFALSAYTTERRTKEIGVRKAMGADTRQVVLLLLWQFTIPVLVATAIAIPLSVLGLSWWLHGFAYHVDLTAWTFVLAVMAAVGIAWATVYYQSFMVARAKPASALRYE